MVTYIMDKWGRKAGVMFVSGIGLFSGALVSASQGVAMFLVFRFFAGIASWGALTISELPILCASLTSLIFRSTSILVRTCTSCYARLFRWYEWRLGGNRV
jgi:MFS family permease